jgi:hypothetical protein
LGEPKKIGGKKSITDDKERDITTTIDVVHQQPLHGWLQGAYTHIQTQSGSHIESDAQSGLAGC